MKNNVGFQLISSNRLDVLAYRLAMNLAQPRAEISLEPDIIIIPQPTLRRWLQVELAQHSGIAANLIFLTPSEWVWKLLRESFPDVPKEAQWDRDNLRWRLWRLLGADDLPNAVQEHLRRAGGDSAVARWRLAEVLAESFDKYQAYRRVWLKEWEEHPDIDDWQGELWRRLRADNPSPSRANLIDAWLEKYDKSSLNPPGLPKQLTAFGTINISPDVLRMMSVSSQFCELAFYFPSPSSQYWGDIETLKRVLFRDGRDALPEAIAKSQLDNELLKSWGAAGRDFVALLFSYEVVQPDHEEEYFVEIEEEESPNLLQTIQNDVLNRRAPRALAWKNYHEHPQFPSLQVHACHSRLREVEILHDRLRGLLDHDPSLQPYEIAVLAPNIGDYLPLVRAVFGGMGREDSRYIPFTLSDRPQIQSHPLIGLFLSLLELAHSRRRVSEVRDLLAVPSVLQALGFQENDLQRLEQWWEGAGIRWGDDEDMRERLGFGRWREYSFEFGMDRLLLGYACHADTRSVGGIAPYPELEGGDSERLDRLIQVLRRLRELSGLLQGLHSALEWQALLAEHFLALIPEVAENDADAQARRTITESLDLFAQQANQAELLPVSVVSAALHDVLEAPSPHQPFLGGGVTFAGMVPLRTVPFKVVCLLGMDSDAFPRQEQGSDINRLLADIHAKRRHLGDRSVRDDDRFLFLQLLMAAQQTFYLSYGGLDARNGKLLEPSPLIAELLEFSKKYISEDGVIEKQCEWKHPLQPFSARSFGAGDSRYFSYQKEWQLPLITERHAAAAFITPDYFKKFDNKDYLNNDHFLTAEGFLITESSPISESFPSAENSPTPENISINTPEISVNNFKSILKSYQLYKTQYFTLQGLYYFFRNPAQHFLRDQLVIQLPRLDKETVNDREPLGENPLHRHLLMQYLLDEGEQNDALLRSQGLLAPGRDGELSAESARSNAGIILKTAEEWLIGNPQIFKHRLAIGTHYLSVYLPEIYFNSNAGGSYQYAVLLPNQEKGKYRLRALLEHLGLAAVLGTKISTRIFFLDKKKEDSVVKYSELPSLSISNARQWLQHLIHLYFYGKQLPLPFVPDASWEFVRSLEGKKSVNMAWQAAVNAFSPYGGWGDANNPAMQLAFRPDGLLGDCDSPTGQAFQQMAIQIFNFLNSDCYQADWVEG